MKSLICILVAFTLIVWIFLGGVVIAKAVWSNNNLGARAERMIPSMIVARDAHQYFVDNPGKAWWNVEEEQDEDWVWIYDEVLWILEEVSK